MYVAVIKCGRGSKLEAIFLSALGLVVFLDNFFLMDETGEYFGLLIGQQTTLAMLLCVMKKTGRCHLCKQPLNVISMIAKP